MTSDTFRKALTHFKVPLKGLRRLRDLAEAFLDVCGVMGEERERALAKVDAKAVKRSQQKATSGEPEGDDEAEELRAADEKDEPPVPVPAILQRLAPAEIAFLRSGVSPAGSALNEEETEDGLKVQRARAEEQAKGASPKVRIAAGGVAPTPSGGAASSSSGMGGADPGVAPAAGMVAVPEEPVAEAEAVDSGVARALSMPRMLAAESERDIPEGCTLNCYEPAGKSSYLGCEASQGCDLSCI